MCHYLFPPSGGLPIWPWLWKPDVIGAVKDGKKVIAVPRLARYGEHVDDHHTEIVRQFGEMGLIEPCMDPADLPEAYTRAMTKDYLPYRSNTARFCADLSEYIDGLGGGR